MNFHELKMDSLQEIPYSKWKDLKENLKKMLPKTEVWILNNVLFDANPDFVEALRIKLYCPYGDFNEGIVCARFDVTATKIYICPINEDVTKLETALKTTSVFNPSTMLDEGTITVFCCMTKDVWSLVGRLPWVEAHMKTYKVTIFEMFAYRGKELKERECPSDAYLAPVTKRDIPRILKISGFKTITEQYLTHLTSFGFSYGMYTKSDDKLQAWLFRNEFNNLRLLYCEESCRKKGYAKVLLKHVMNKIVKEGFEPTSFIEKHNELPLMLIKKLNFEDVGEFYFYGFR